MNKKALLGSIFLAVIIILIIGGGIVYYQIKKEGVQVTSGNLVFDITYNESEDTQKTLSQDDIKIVEEVKNQTTNQTINVTQEQEQENEILE
tara:strand:- start:4477 stop:4752 length:276 start_codon:yes stop_codon:yes gene_type:complete